MDVYARFKYGFATVQFRDSKITRQSAYVRTTAIIFKGVTSKHHGNGKFSKFLNLPCMKRNDLISQSGLYSMTMDNAIYILNNCGSMYVVELCNEFCAHYVKAHTSISTDVEALFVSLAHGILVLNPQRDSSNKVISTMPPCLPISSARLSKFNFTELMFQQIGRLCQSVATSSIDALENEFIEFVGRFKLDYGFQELVLTTSSSGKTFEQS